MNELESQPAEHESSRMSTSGQAAGASLADVDPASSGLSSDDGLFPIRAVSSITGVNPITLRAWERRYNLIRPTRTATGHRLYSAADIQEIKRIMALSAQGVGFAQIAQILARESQTNAQGLLQGSLQDPSIEHERVDEQARQPDTLPAGAHPNLVESLKLAVIHIDPLALRRAEQQAMMWLSPDQVMRSVLIDAYAQLERRDAWPDRDLGLRWYGHHVRQRLEWWLMQQARKPTQAHPLILIDETSSGRVLTAAECAMIMALTRKGTIQLMPPELSESHRIRQVNRWQARHWIRLLDPDEKQPHCSGEILSGATRLHWCQLLAEEQTMTITPNGICRGGVDQCQRYLLDQIT